MSYSILINSALITILVGGVVALWYSYLNSRRTAKLVDSLAGTMSSAEGMSRIRNSAVNEPFVGLRASQETISEEYLENINKVVRATQVKSKARQLQEKYFRAGLFRKAQRQSFEKLKLAFLLLIPLAFYLLGSLVDSTYALVTCVAGVIVAFYLPSVLLDRLIQKRDYDILYYLPLEIEQLVIGVSSSLDIGPCIQGVVTMADERDCHNPVTELFKFVQHFVKAGATLHEALIEVGKLSCHTELKHAFMALAQVSRHGGEITKQLQQLADSVSQQRETRVEAKIKKLELEATGPVALVFLAFMGILLIGLGAQISMVFSQ